MTLPNPEKAVVDIIKLRDYCLSPQHRRGQHKARVFASALGLTQKHAGLLRQALLSAALTHQATSTEENQYGQRYRLDFSMTGPNETTSCNSQWLDCEKRRGFSTLDHLFCAIIT